jgi:hypothetical protein
MAKPAPRSQPAAPRQPSSWHSRPAAQEKTVAALRKARALENVQAVDTGQPREPGLLQQWLRMMGLILGSLAGILMFLASLVFFAGSILLGRVMDEISQRDFAGVTERISQYESFFDEINKAGYRVSRDNPSVLEGVTTYLWTVQPPGSDELCVFQWEHNLAENKVLEKTSGAVYLDIKLEFITPDEATKVACYDANDALSRAIVNSDTALLQQVESGGWVGQAPEGPVMAPLISPEDGMGRAGAAGPAEEETPAEGEAAAGEAQPGEAVEVGAGEDGGGAGDTPPATEVGAGDGGGDGDGGGETPPDDGGGAGDADGSAPGGGN